MVAGLAVACGAVIWGLNDRSTVSIVARESAATYDADSLSVSDTVVGPSTTASFETLRTFRGVSEDGQLRVNRSDNLVIDMALRRWFEFYLLAIGEWTLDEIKRAMMLRIAELPNPGRQQALDLMNDYIAYRDALGSFQEEMQKRIAESDPNIVAEVMAWKKRLRREYFEPNVVDAFFRNEEAHDDFMVSQIELRQQGASTEEIMALEANLPKSMQITREKFRTVIDLQQQMQHFEEEGVNQESIDEYRREKFGDAAANRLARLDQKRAEWEERIIAFQRYKQRAISESQSPDELTSIIEQYIKDNFSENEQKRVEAYSQIMAKKAT